MARVKDAVLIVANALFDAVCLGNVERYLALKGRVMIAAAKLHLYEASYMKLLRVFVREGAADALSASHQNLGRLS